MFSTDDKYRSSDFYFFFNAELQLLYDAEPDILYRHKKVSVVFDNPHNHSYLNLFHLKPNIDKNLKKAI